MAMRVRRPLAGLAVLCALLGQVGCSTTTRQDALVGKLSAQDQLNEQMAAADKALQAGQQDEALGRLDAAVKVDPAAKAPWLKKAQIHFEAQRYGLAIVDAQEVLQRDANDLTAKSILAVSGLRVSASALEDLRKINEVKGSARTEAESVATLIREVLGEPVLVPSPSPVAQTPDAARKSTPTSRHTPRVTPRIARPAMAASATSSETTPTAGAPAGGRMNPFGALQ